MLTCSPDAFDERGTWQFAPERAKPWDYCPIREKNLPVLKAGERTGCNTTRNHGGFVWRTYTPRCRHHHEHFGTLLNTLPRNATLWVYGDSMSRAHWRAVACRLLEEEMQDRGCHDSACRDTSRSWHEPGRVRCDPACGLVATYPMPAALWGSDSALGNRTDAWLQAALGAHDCVQFSSGRGSLPSYHRRVCMVGWRGAASHPGRLVDAHGGGAYADVTPPAEQIRALDRLGGLRPHSDVLMINAGLTPFGHNLNFTLQPLATLMAELRARGVRVLWRETAPQHFPHLPNVDTRRWANAALGSMGAEDDARFFLWGMGTPANAYHKHLTDAYRLHGRCEEPQPESLLDCFLAPPDLASACLTNACIHTRTSSAHIYTDTSPPAGANQRRSKAAHLSHCATSASLHGCGCRCCPSGISQ